MREFYDLIHTIGGAVCVYGVVIVVVIVALALRRRSIDAISHWYRHALQGEDHPRPRSVARRGESLRWVDGPMGVHHPVGGSRSRCQ